jgi:hypothetical protein
MEFTVDMRIASLARLERLAIHNANDHLGHEARGQGKRQPAELDRPPRQHKKERRRNGEPENRGALIVKLVVVEPQSLGEKSGRQRRPAESTKLATAGAPGVPSKTE